MRPVFIAVGGVAIAVVGHASVGGDSLCVFPGARMDDAEAPEGEGQVGRIRFGQPLLNGKRPL